MVSLRSATVEDVDAVGAIYAHHVETSVATFELTAPDRAEWLRRFASTTTGGLPFVVAERDGEILGYAYCAPWKTRPAYRQTVEDSVYVAPHALGNGVGGRLLDALLADCAAAGVREVIAVIVDDTAGIGTASLVLHRNRGFDEAGRLRGVGFKHGRWLDTVLMQRSLVAP